MLARPTIAARTLTSGRTAGALIGYAVLFLLFDAQALAFEVAPGVSPWYATAGLNLALVLLLGPAAVPMIIAAMLVSGLIISDPPIGIEHLVVPVLIVALGNGAAGAWLRGRLKAHAAAGPGRVMAARLMGRLLAVALLLPAGIAVGASLSYLATGLDGYTWEALPSIVFAWWLGDAAGILTFAPLLLVAAGPLLHPRIFRSVVGEPLRLPRPRDVRGLAELLSIPLTVWTAFALSPGDRVLFFLCFLPLLGIALRHGFPRASLAVVLTNVSAVLAIRWLGADTAVLDLQVFMIALALTGFLIGGLATERLHAIGHLQQASRLLHYRIQSYASEQHIDHLPHEPDPAQRRDDLSLAHHIEVLRDGQQALADSMMRLARLNGRLGQSEQELRRINAQKDRLFSIVSHDLKNPLVGIQGLAEVLLEDESPADERAELLAAIRDAALRSYSLMHNLLEWARLQTGEFEASPQRLDVGAVIDDNLRLAGSAASQKGIALTARVEESITAWADEHMTHTILRNLISNALKFTPPGGSVVVEVSGTSAGVEIAVIDTGVGMPPEQCECLFDIDGPGSTPGTAGEEGTGLGLPLAHEMASYQHSLIHVESEEGSGSCFRLVLPSRPVQDAQPSGEVVGASSHVRQEA